MTEDDWLDACADEPDDDLRRRAFADWLEERGDHDRAEFIRLQVTLSRVREDERDQARVQRAAELLTRHRTEWLGPLLDVVLADAWEFPRGLPETLDLSDWRLGTAAVAELVASLHPARLTTLKLYDNRIGDVGAEALAATPHLARLTLLDLGDNQIRTAGAEALSATPHLPRLTLLYLRHNEIGDAGAASPHLARLNNLDLWNNGISAAGTEALRQAFGDRVRL
jgi:uncharacterized protein (TIGR02996 family)